MNDDEKIRRVELNARRLAFDDALKAIEASTNILTLKPKIDTMRTITISALNKLNNDRDKEHLEKILETFRICYGGGSLIAVANPTDLERCVRDVIAEREA